MTFTLTLGWWIAPLVISAVLSAWAIPVRADERSHGDYSFSGVESAFRFFVIALPLSLVSWLVWALLT